MKKKTLEPDVQVRNAAGETKRVPLSHFTRGSDEHRALIEGGWQITSVPARRGPRLTTLLFDLADVRRVVEHARKAPQQRQFYGEQLGPQVLLVKDEGIYLMSNGVPRDMLDGAPDELGAQSFVAYAHGYDPNVVTDGLELHMKCREAVGGDDFSEPLGLEGFETALADPTVTSIGLRVSDETIDIVVYERPPRTRRH